MKTKSHHYIVDSKLLFYYLHQRGGSVAKAFNKLADLLIEMPKGEIHICGDIGHSDYREKMYEEYKGHRREQMAKRPKKEQEEHKKFNEDCLTALEGFHKLGLHVLAIEGVEADDLASLLTLHIRKNEPDANITLITGDYDWIHLLIEDAKVRMFDFPQHTMVYRKDAIQTYKLDSRRKFSILKSICGDISDNIKFVNNLAKVRGRKIFDDIHKKYENPTDKQIILYITQEVEENDKFSVHEAHTKHGRKTVAEAFTANMLIADPFTDYTKLTEEQAVLVDEALQGTYNIPAERPSKPSSEDFMDWAIDSLGSVVLLSNAALKVYGIKE